MAWHDIFTKLLTTSTTHADNFNNIFGEALENDKHLLNQINVLSTNALRYKGIINTDLDNYKEQGVYRIVNVIPAELQNKFSGYGVYIVERGETYISRRLIDIVNNKIFFSTIRDNGTISKWDELATTTKTDILQSQISALEARIVKLGG